MEVDTEMAVQRAREVAQRKTEQRYPYPHHVFEKRQYFAYAAAKEFCDLVLPGGYEQLIHCGVDGG